MDSIYIILYICKATFAVLAAGVNDFTAVVVYLQVSREPVGHLPIRLACKIEPTRRLTRRE